MVEVVWEGDREGKVEIKEKGEKGERVEEGMGGEGWEGKKKKYLGFVI